SGVERRVGIVVQAVRRFGHPAFGLHDDGARAEGSHVKPDGSGTRTSVVGEGHGTLGRISAIERVGDEEHLGVNLAGCVLDRHASSSGGVAQRASVDGDGVMRLHGRDFLHVPLVVGGAASSGALTFGGGRSNGLATLFLLLLALLSWRLWRSGLRWSLCGSL